MNWRMAAMALFIPLLAACGDDGAPAEATGVFRAGGVAGVRYETMTRTGTTDASGTFRYLPGENVYFSIGGIELGSAPGAPEINPFTLAGTTPPGTELALRGELDLTRRMPTRLGRALNIQYLLIALDGDHNPANGIDVTAKAATLADTELDLGLHIGAFLANLQRRVPGLTANVPQSSVLAFLYRALNIRVPAHADTRAEVRYGTSLPAVTTNAYGSDGRHANQSSDSDGDGNLQSSNSWTYDALGRITSNAYTYPSLGFTGTARSLNYEYDARGLRSRTIEEANYDFLGFLQQIRTVSRFTHDANDFTLSELAESDFGNDGTMDSRYAIAYTYDAHHNLTLQRFESDFDLDGVSNETATLEASYDDRDRVTHRRDEVDRDGDGVTDQRFESSFEYAGNNPGSGRETAISDYDADGIVDTRAVIDTVYDASGSLLSRVYMQDNDANGVVDTIYRNSWTYDASQRPLTEVSSTDYDGDGNADFLARAALNYDSVGNLLTSRVEYDTFGEREVDAFVTDTYQYGASGELLGAVSTSVSDGPVDFIVPSTTTVTNVVIPDGVLMLAQRYLEYFPGVVQIYPGIVGGGVVSTYVDSFSVSGNPTGGGVFRASY